MSSLKNPKELISQYARTVRHEKAMKEAAQLAAETYRMATLERNVAWGEVKRLLLDGTIAEGVYHTGTPGSYEVLVMSRNHDYPDILHMHKPED